MVARIHYRWDFIGLSTDNKPTPETSEKVVDGSTYYCSDNSKLYVWYKTQWYERKPLGGGGGGGSYTAGTGIDITDDTISVDTNTIQAKLTAGDNITITDDTISATDTTYTAFTGTDGTAAGTVGLVPAPATTDAGKFLKADGTWDTAGGGSGPTVVQTTGTSTTDVMSQKAVTSMVYADPSLKSRVQIGDNAQAQAANTVSIGAGAVSSTVRSVAVGPYSVATQSYSVALGYGSTANAQGEVGIGLAQAYNTSGYNNSQYRLLTGLYDGQSAHDAATKGQLDSIAIQNAGAPTTATVGTVGQLLEDTTNGKLYICTDATNPYVWVEVGAGGGGESAIKMLSTSDYNYPADNPSSVALWLLDEGFYEIPASGVTVNVSATTTWSPGYGEIVEVTKTQAGTPKSVLYFFGNAGGYAYAVITISSGAEEVAYTRMLNMNDLVQTTGTGTNSVMSQNATTSMVFADPATQYKIKIGAGTSTSEGSNAVEIGHSAAAVGNSGVAVGNSSTASKLNTIAIGANSLARGQESIAIGDGSDTGNDITNSVALGSGAQCHYNGEVNIGSENSYQAGYNSSNYRLLTGLYDGQSAHDAVTVEQVNATIDAINTALSTNIPHIGA